MAVWINVRTTPVPPLPDLDKVLINAKLDGNNMIIDPFSEGFFLRSVVVTPDAKVLLNPQAPTIPKSVLTLAKTGHFPYAQIESHDYMRMLVRALNRHRETRGKPPLDEHAL